jgi:hypothetical protein
VKTQLPCFSYQCCALLVCFGRASHEMNSCLEAIYYLIRPQLEPGDAVPSRENADWP